MHTKCCETLIDIITPNTYIHTYIPNVVRLLLILSHLIHIYTYIHTYIPNVVRLLLIFCASLSLSPVAPVLPTFSEPT